MQILHKGIMGQAGEGMKRWHRPLLPTAAMILSVLNYGKDREGKRKKVCSSSVVLANVSVHMMKLIMKYHKGKDETWKRTPPGRPWSEKSLRSPTQHISVSQLTVGALQRNSDSNIPETCLKASRISLLVMKLTVTMLYVGFVQYVISFLFVLFVIF